MLTDVMKFLVETWVKLWNMLLNGGYIGLAIIAIPMLRKVAYFFKQFTN